MKTAFFNTKSYDRKFFDEANREGRQEIRYLEAHFNASTAPLAKGFEAVCVFVNDQVDAASLAVLRGEGVRYVLTRSAGFNHIDLPAAKAAGIRVFRVPDYSPHAVAEHALGLILSLDRKIHRSYHRVREGNFSLEGLLGFDLQGKTVGVVGLGKIGQAAARILKGFGCEVLAS
ncbi:MAG TPA: NAD(P)-dependent oxidoreductase, partial [bacterium]|nr:NAD(P)-dependent oxidoreductase [bacterium]